MIIQNSETENIISMPKPLWAGSELSPFIPANEAVVGAIARFRKNIFEKERGIDKSITQAIERLNDMGLNKKDLPDKGIDYQAKEISIESGM